ncbi:phospholipase D-like domain-containing protein [Bradyrhizobium brasilense]|uniref:phospholipase D-like domain-containing protein n=1 Tax=Bradyrhizobium brasilense TaxID=1419277 RepID=UPI0024B13B43|nr:phospholipase D-like domain-containing protein [Bradyrhizobium australafricanum]WFU33636.1 phospholipase D-like domain-containing protein [Bradyrhizobium australafricanum]
MGSVSRKNGDFSLRAYRGDAKTLLAFNFASKAATKNLAGFTIACQPKGGAPYYIHNQLRFEKPADHAQVASEPADSSINAPIHKFRWVHVPGQVHQGLQPFFGDYTYTVTPRFFDDKRSLQPLEPTLSASVDIEVNEFVKGNLTLGFARGYTQSQAFDNHFGKDTKIQPDGRALQFDTSQIAGKNAQGEEFSYQQAYEWLGFTAREKIFAVLDEVLSNKNLLIDVFAYDLNEPDMVDILLKLAKQGRIRIILDNAALHHKGKPKKKSSAAAKKSKKPKAPPLEDAFEKAFVTAAGKKQLLKRGKFKRYAHDKVFVVYKKGARANKPIKVMTGSTNFSVTGIYVNSNHILIYDDPEVAAWYAGVFAEAWKDNVKGPAFEKSTWSNQTFSTKDKRTPKTDITFAPHDQEHASAVLKVIVDRIDQESKQKKGEGSVLFAVMAISSPPRKNKKTGKVSKSAPNPVYDALKGIHSNDKVFSFGISDSPGGTWLYPLGKKTGVLVTGKPVNTQLPPPFSQVPNILGVGHQIHHKFVVCGFRGDDPVVFCGSSNLALGGEEANGDNLLAIYDGDVATVFVIEALLLVDHFNFLDSTAKGPKSKQGPKAKKQADMQEMAVDAGWFLSTSDGWAAKYYDPKDLHSIDRELFA